MTGSEIIHKEVGGMQIASLQAVIAKRADIPPLLERLAQVCGDAICGPAMAIFHYGSVREGLLVEVAYPVSRAVDTGEVHTRLLERRKAWTLVNHDSPETNRAATLEIYKYLETHAGMIGGGTRELYLHIDPSHPEKNITEIQVLDHEWTGRLSQGAREVLGAEACQQVMHGIQSLTPASTADDYRAWVHSAMNRIDALTDDPQDKYRIVSCAAHVFPQYRIDHLKEIYQQHHDLDAVLTEMYTDPDWYEDPTRKGNQLFIRKVPYDPEALKKAVTPAERRQAYCHCALVRPYLEKMPAGISPTFCWCGSGWYRRLWEGILGKPIQVEHVETLVTGGESCRLIITLPVEAHGEFLPPLRE